MKKNNSLIMILIEQSIDEFPRNYEYIQKKKNIM